jgi:hypothetical protein
MNKKISGKLILRDKGDAPDGSGRQLVLVMGVVAIPREDGVSKQIEASDTVFMVHGSGIDLMAMEPIETLSRDEYGPLRADQVLTRYRKWQV